MKNIPISLRFLSSRALPNPKEIARSWLCSAPSGFRPAFVLSSGHAQGSLDIIQEAFRKTYNDPEFHKEYKKLTADEAHSLMPDAHEKMIKEIPRDPEIAAIFKQIAGAGPLPPR